MKQTRMLSVSLRGVNFFGKFGLARVSREKLRYTVSTIRIIITALNRVVNILGLGHLLGLFSAPVAAAICLSFYSFLFLLLYMQ